jgi:hypothetical protein
MPSLPELGFSFALPTVETVGCDMSALRACGARDSSIHLSLYEALRPRLRAGLDCGVSSAAADGTRFTSGADPALTSRATIVLPCGLECGGLYRLLKKSRKQIPRRLKPPRDDKEITWTLA